MNLLTLLFVTYVTLTCYNPERNQCDSTPLVTADGTKIDMKKLRKGEVRYVSVSRDLLEKLPYGSRVHIEGHGVYEVHDTMHKRYSHRIDIMQHPKEKAFKKEKIKVTKIE